MIMRVFDELQMWLHMQGWHGAAAYVGRWGTPAKPAKQEGERPLRVIDFDPLYNRTNGIDASDIATASSRYDIN